MTELAAPGWPADLPPFAELVASLGDIDGAEESDAPSMDMDEITLRLAIELEVRDPDSPLPRVTGSTPTQWTETSILPVFHRLSVRVAPMNDA